MLKQVDVPYKPKVKGAADTSNFDQDFTSEPVVDSLAPQGSALSKTLQQNAGEFSGFTFVNKGKLGQVAADDDD